jgi:preprotein translocase subunit SecB
MTQKEELKVHPIQLRFLGVKELVAKTFIPPTLEIQITKLDPSSNARIRYIPSEYDEQKRTFSAIVSVQIGTDDEDNYELPVYLKVSLIGIFFVDESVTDRKLIDFFIKNNAQYILHPYIREQVFSLSAKCGITPVILPTITIPTLPGIKKKEVNNKKSSSKMTKDTKE